jgi:hypothetical protein
MSEEKEGTKFQVKDRRRFAGDGEARQEPETPKAADAPLSFKAEPAAAQDRATGSRPAADKSAPADLPEINFGTFVISLSSSVLIHLGLVQDPMSGETRRELPLAKQTIDILGMLQDKTRGNLTKEEGELMEGLLFDLRMRYVEESKKP